MVALSTQWEAQLQSSEFLNREAELLDDGDLVAWLELLSDDIDYRIPVRTTRERAAASSPFSDAAFHMIEDNATLHARVARLASEYAWAEEPPSRTRRFVTNIRVSYRDADASDAIDVKSNLLVFRATGDLSPVLISCERKDLLTRRDDRWTLARRLVLLDHTAIPMNNLAIFL